MANSRPQGLRNRARVEAVERALLLLKSFESAGENLSLAMLAQRTELYKSTILRLSSSLRYMGFLRRSADGQFQLGPEIRRLGMLILGAPATEVENLVRPALRRLVKATRETASFYVTDGKQRICLYRENSPSPARHHLEEGSTLPLRHGAPGLILRAFGSRTTDARSVGIRETGYALSRGERHAELAGVAVPVFNCEDELVGAMGVSGLISRFSDPACEKTRRALLREAAQLKAKIPAGVNTSVLSDRTRLP
jgi:DNA-binding IclR family transcriptional regulator